MAPEFLNIYIDAHEHYIPLRTDAPYFQRKDRFPSSLLEEREKKKLYGSGHFGDDVLGIHNAGFRRFLYAQELKPSFFFHLCVLYTSTSSRAMISLYIFQCTHDRFDFYWKLKESEETKLPKRSSQAITLYRYIASITLRRQKQYTYIYSDRVS